MYFLPCMQLCSCLHLQNIMGLSHYSTYPFTMWTSHRWPSSSLKRFIEMSWIIQKGKKVSVCNYWTGTMRVSAWSCWCFNRNKCRKWLGHGGKSQNITVVLESVSLVLCLLTLNPLSLMRRREGRYHRLLHLGQHTRGKEDVASNSLGATTPLRRRYVDVCSNRIWKPANNSTSLQGFLVFNTNGGGAGSGFGSPFFSNSLLSIPRKAETSYRPCPCRFPWD